MNAQEIWENKWPFETHNCEYAFKRMKSAQSAKLTPVSIDKENASGVFKGSGKLPYQVTLESCTCGDFHRAHLPCKHMYRLAAELDVMIIDTESYSARAYSWEEMVEIVENLSENAQKEFVNIIRGVKKNEVINIRIKKSDAVYELIKAGIVTSGKETPKYIDINILNDYTADIHQTYQYFNRKFNPPEESYYDPDTDEGETEYKPLANDSRTARLLEKGFAHETPTGIFIKGYENPNKYESVHKVQVSITGIAR